MLFRSQLPDLRAEFLRGYDDGRGIDTDRVFGSSQEGTKFALGSGIYPQYESGGDEYYSDETTSPLSDPPGFDGTYTSIRVRPRNVAMLACIKY